MGSLSIFIWKFTGYPVLLTFCVGRANPRVILTGLSVKSNAQSIFKIKYNGNGPDGVKLSSLCQHQFQLLAQTTIVNQSEGSTGNRTS